MSTRIEKCQGRLTVYFEDPFWVGVFEKVENGKLSAAKVTFGAEPKDYEVQEFPSKHTLAMLDWGPFLPRKGEYTNEKNHRIVLQTQP